MLTSTAHLYFFFKCLVWQYFYFLINRSLNIPACVICFWIISPTSRACPRTMTSICLTNRSLPEPRRRPPRRHSSGSLRRFCFISASIHQRFRNTKVQTQKALSRNQEMFTAQKRGWHVLFCFHTRHQQGEGWFGQKKSD